MAQRTQTRAVGTKKRTATKRSVAEEVAVKPRAADKAPAAKKAAKPAPAPKAEAKKATTKKASVAKPATKARPANKAQASKAAAPKAKAGAKASAPARKTARPALSAKAATKTSRAKAPAPIKARAKPAAKPPVKASKAAAGKTAPAKAASARRGRKSAAVDKNVKAPQPYLAAELGQPVDHDGEPIGAGSPRAQSDRELQEYALQLWRQMQSGSVTKRYMRSIERAGLTVDDIWVSGVRDTWPTSSTPDEMRRYRQKALFRANLLEAILSETVGDLRRLEGIEPTPPTGAGEPA